MIISDTHTHLYLKEFDSDRDQVINKAIRANVTRLFLPAIDSSHTQSMLTLKRKFPKNKKENIYLLTEKGIGLTPIIIEFSLWGDTYMQEFNEIDTIDSLKEDKLLIIDTLNNNYNSMVLQLA